LRNACAAEKYYVSERLTIAARGALQPPPIESANTPARRQQTDWCIANDIIGGKEFLTVDNSILPKKRVMRPSVARQQRFKMAVYGFNCLTTEEKLPVHFFES
jgi:hypothetical protein